MQIPGLPLSEQGSTIRLITPSCSNSSATDDRVDVTSVALIGPRVNAGAVGGCTVAFEELVAVLQDLPGIRLEVVDSGVFADGRGVVHRILRVGLLAFRLVRAAIRNDVLCVHSTSTQLFLSSAVSLGLARAFGKRVIVRKFGGQSHRLMPPRLAVERWPYTWAIEQVLKRVDLFLAETRSNVAVAQASGLAHVRWFPNSRRPRVRHNIADKKASGLVYIGHVKKTKGIFELIEAAEQLPGTTTVDVFGPLCDGITESVFRGSRCVHYRGELAPSEVGSALSLYDALVLPTYWDGEGYPGVIIEALQEGLPVIATRWKSIPEMVDDSCALLVPVRDAYALGHAMQRFVANPDLQLQLRMGAIVKGAEFDARLWGRRYAEWCKSLHRTGSVSA